MGSTSTRIVPPQASPTAKASPSLTPYSSITGLPSSMASSASATTAPSTQPPETEPSISPCPEIASWLPTRRGALPQVSTTVAKAAPLPARCHASAVSGMSSKRSILLPPLQRRHQPRFFAIIIAARDRLGQILQRGDGMARAERVHMRQHRANALRLGREPLPPEQRVEPYQPPRRQV